MRAQHSTQDLDETWTVHAAAWRDPHQIVGQWEGASVMSPTLMRARVRGAWWDTLAEKGVTLLVTREYEHLVMGLSFDRHPVATYLAVPHPSGMVVDRTFNRVHLASTRNPNVIFEMAPISPAHDEEGRGGEDANRRVLAPLVARYLPGALYIHDLALIGGDLHANAVGENAVVRIRADGRRDRVWWPRCIEEDGTPDFRRNYIQLNSIAAGEDLASSFFTASSETRGHRRPGHLNYPVDRRGVLFSGATRLPIARGLTRPHSARLASGRLWLANSGYGEVGMVDDGRFEPVARLRGWTRGLTVVDDVVFVGTSRVIPKFRAYAPGLTVEESECAVHAIRAGTGELLGSIAWPRGNQIFALEWLPTSVSSGFPFSAEKPGNLRATRQLFSRFSEEDQ